MSIARSAVVLTALAGGLVLPSTGLGAPTLELYSTFESMGVIVTLAPGDDPDRDATASLEYRPAGSGAYRPGFAPDRILLGRFVGSLFRLAPDNEYDVRVSLTDPDHGPVDGVVLLATAATRPEVVLPQPLRSLFSSPSGSGTACSRTSPCTLSQALGQVSAGEEVVLLAGVYRTGGLSLAGSGSPGAPIVVRADSPGQAVLDGADPAVRTWTAVGGGVYRSPAGVAAPQVVADGQRLYPYQSLADLQSLRWGVPGFFADATYLHVRLAADGNPSGSLIEVSRENVAFILAAGRDHFAFVGLTFRNYGRGSSAKAIYLNGGSDNLVRQCVFRHNGIGVGIKGGSARNLIEDSDFSDTRDLWSWDAAKAAPLTEATATKFFEPATGRGNVIRRNHVEGGFDGIGCAPETTGGAPTSETDVHDNVVEKMGDDGLTVDGAGSNVRIWGNRFHDVLVGVSLAPSYGGPTYVLRNLVYRTDTGNNQYTGSPFKLNSGFPGSGVIYLLHNTVDVVTAGQNSLHILTPGDWTKLVARNNIFAATQYVIRNQNTGQPIDLDYDCTYTSGANFGSWTGFGILPTLASFQAATGQETNAVFAPPDFADPTAGDYTLRSTSGCIDRGVALPGINDDASGAGPDMGALEQVLGGAEVLSVTRVSPDPTRAATVQYVVAFSDAVTGVDAGDFCLNTTGIGGAGVTAVAGSGPARTVTVATGTGSGTLRLDVCDNDTIVDQEGNPLGGPGAGNGDFTTGEVYTIDRTRPSLVLSTPAEVTGTAPIPVTATFSEPVVGFALGDVTVTNATTSNFVAVGGGVYTFDLAPTVDPGTVTARVPASRCTDPVGNTNLASNTLSVLYDTSAPAVVSIVRLSADPTRAATVKFRVTFTEPVAGVDVSDFTLTVSGVSAPAVTAVTGSGATRDVTISTGTGNGTIRLNLVDDDSITDLGGNRLGGTGTGNGGFSGGQTYTVDKTRPTVVLTTTAPDPTGASPIRVTATFSEPVTGFIAADLTVTNATVSQFAGSGAVYTFNLLPAAPGTVTVKLPAAKAADAAGNTNLASNLLSRTYQP